MTVNTTSNARWRYVEAESWHFKAIAIADAGKLTDLEAIKDKWVNRAKHPADGQGEH